jgi:predicted negative regulator of RcsB-dependent stress response
LSKVYRRTGNLEQAEKSAEDSLAQFRRMGSKLFHALALLELSKIRREQGDVASAISPLAQSIAEIRLLQDQFNLVIALCILGDLYLLLNDTNSASAVWQEALAIAHQHEHPNIRDLEQRLQSLPINAQQPRLVD